jgi:hypothetical protein
MSKDVRIMVDDAHAQVDFFVNVWFLAILFIAVALVRCVGKAYSAMPDLTHAFTTSWGFGLTGIVGLLVCRLANAGAVERAHGWGALVKSAFDLYLPALAKQTGYELPPTGDQRRRFWEGVTSTFLYQLPMKPEDWPAIMSAGVTPQEPKNSDDEGRDDHAEGDDGDDKD